MSSSSSKSGGDIKVGERPRLVKNEIKEVRVYGNGKIPWTFGTHHVLVVLRTDSFTLLELERRSENKIHIRMEEACNLDRVLEKRFNTKDTAEFWCSEDVDSSTDAVQVVINDFHNNSYVLVERDCRRFVDKVCKSVGANILVTILQYLS